MQVELDGDAGGARWRCRWSRMEMQVQLDGDAGGARWRSRWS